MNPSDVKTAVEGLPFKKYASTQQMVVLLGCVVGLLWVGVTIGNKITDARTAITASIAAVDGKVDKLADSENWIKASMMSKPEMAVWASQLDKNNRRIDAGNGLVVPDVPPIIAPSYPAPTTTAAAPPNN
jgi:hypothetical protein